MLFRSTIILTMISFILSCKPGAEEISSLKVIPECGFNSNGRLFSRFVDQCLTDFVNPARWLIDGCLDQFTTLYPVMPQQCQEMHISPIKDKLTKSIRSFSDSNDFIADKTTLLDFFKVASKWSEASKLLYTDYSYSRDPDSYQALRDYIKSNFWSQNNSQLLEAEKVLNDDHIDSSLIETADIAYELLSAADNAQTLEYAILLSSPFFSALQNKLDNVTKMHDILCRVSKCDRLSADLSSNDIYGAILIIGNILFLDSNLDEISGVDLHNPIIRTLLVLHDKKSLILDLLASSAESRISILPSEFYRTGITNKEKEAILLDQEPVIDDPSANEFLSLLVSSRKRASNLKETSLFNENTDSRLEYSPTSSKVDSANILLGNLVRNFRSEYDTYISNRVNYLNRLKTSISENSQIVDYEKKALFSRQQELSNDINAARESVQHLDKNLADYFIGLLNEDSPFKNFSLEGSTSISIAANNTAYQSSNLVHDDTLIEALSIQHKKIESDKDRLLKINVLGKWQPKCALSRDANFSNVSREDLSIGPEGYYLSFSNSSGHVTSSSQTQREIDYTDSSVSVNACAKYSFGNDTVGGGVSACANYTRGRRQENITSNSSVESIETRTSAAFSGGLRLADTPFPSLPAGALLGIISKGGAGSTIADVKEVRVIHPTDAIELLSGETLHFVVNDCSGNGDKSLQLEVNSYLSDVDIMRQAINAVLSFRGSLSYKDRVKTILNQGADISGDLSNLRNTFYLEILNEVPDYGNFRQVAELVNFWIDNEIIKVQKQHTVKLLLRELNKLDWQMKSLELNYEIARKSEVINQSLLSTLLTEIDYSFLQEKFEKMLSFSDVSMSPILRLYFPNLYISFEDDYLEFLDYSISEGTSQYMDFMYETLDSLHNEISHEILFNEDSQVLNIMLRVPKPDLDIPVNSVGGMPIADYSIRSNIWSYLEQSLNGSPLAPLQIKLPLDSFYQNRRTVGVLSCRQVRPLIESMVLGFATSGRMTEPDLNNLNAGPEVIELLSGPQVTYSGEEGPINFRLYDRIGRTSQRVSSLPIQYVKLNRIGSISGLINSLSAARNAALGLSPYSDFTLTGLDDVFLNFSQNYSPLESVSELVLAFRVHVDTVGTNINWTRSCL